MNTTGKGRVRVYPNVKQHLALAQKIYEKHRLCGDKSPLITIDGFNWEATGPKVLFCLNKHKEATNLSRIADELFRQRDAVFAEIIDITMASKAILQEKFILYPDILQEWGMLTIKNQDFSITRPP